MNPYREITVCDTCFRASCWKGEVMCDYAFDAGTVEMRYMDLAEMNLEHPSHWEDY